MPRYGLWGDQNGRMSAGFSLIELLVALAVAAIGLSLAIPAFTHMVASNQLTGNANDIVGSLRAARLEAIKRNSFSEFCSSVDADNGSDTLAGSSGCNSVATRVVALDSSGNPQIVRAPIALSTSVSLGDGSNKGTALQPIRFAGDGLGRKPSDSAPFSGLVADVFTARIDTDNHRCIYLQTGSVLNVCSYSSTSGGCPTSEPANCSN